MNFSVKLKRAAITLVMSMLCLFTFAQSYTVRGVVTDASGEPIIGANVAVKGTNNGTITDFDGKFTLDDVKPVNVLEVSYIGYVTQNVRVGSQANFTIMLHEDDKTLDEVVVIGYGTMKKRDITGAVSSVSSDKIVDPVTNISQALQGKLAGVSVMSTDGRPGASVKVRVRGGGSISQSNEPLYIVDGFPASTIADLSAEQIESIDVLKDAASTAIYGASGANGVVLITTRSAQTGEKVRVLYDGYIQAASASKTLETLNAQEYVKYTWAHAKSLGQENDVAKYFGLGEAYGNNYNSYANVASHDYTDDLLRTAMTQSHNLSITGGSERTKIAFNLNYMNAEGIKKNSGYKRLGAYLKMGQKLSEKVRFEIDVRYNGNNTEGRESSVNGRGTAVSGAYMYRPIDTPLGTDDESLLGDGSNNVSEYYNPTLINDGTLEYYETTSVNGNAALEWDIFDCLKFRTEFGGGRNESKDRYFTDGYSNNGKTVNYASVSKGDGWGYRSATTLNWDVLKNNDSNQLNILVGNEIIGQKSSKLSANGQDYPSSYTADDAWGNLGSSYNSSYHGEGDTQYSYGFTNTIGTPVRSISFFGRLNYNLKDKYMLTFTARADGSSKFASKHQWGYFPAGAFAWRLGDERFMEDTKDWLSNLKLRLSYGTAGANNINSSLWKTTYTSTTQKIDGKTVSSYKPSTFLGNEDLKWETTISRNFGIDYGFAHNRITGSIDLYWNTTKDLLMMVPVDVTTGFQYQYQNIGKTSNKGVEFAINANIIHKKDVDFTVSATLNYNKNNIDELADGATTLYGSQWGSTGQNPQLDYEFIVGQPVGVIRGFKSAGYYKVSDFDYINGEYVLREGVPDTNISMYPSTTLKAFNLPSGQNAFPGAAKFEDVDGDGEITNNDLTNIGTISHPVTGGFNLNFKYKSLDFNAGFAYAVGGKVYNAKAMNCLNGNKTTLGANRLAFVKDCFQIFNINSDGELYTVTDPDELESLNAGAKYYAPYTLDPYTTSDFVEDASYLRLNTITLGYSFPKNFVKHLAMQKLRVYVTAGNLFTITGYSGVDPEVSAADSKSSGATVNAGGYPTMGLDWGTYPRARTFTFGLNVEF